MTRKLSCRAVASVVLVLVAASPASATFHFARISEIMTSYNSSSEIQFVEIQMLSPSQNLVSGTKLNTFNAQGDFVATALTVPSNVTSGAQKHWLMGTTAFEVASGLQVDFEFPDGALPPAGGMVCWGDAGNTPTPIVCDGTGDPYVDCIAYGSYSGPSNNCTGDPTPLSPDGHSLRRTSNDLDNATAFECGDPADPTNNDDQSASMEATTPCGGVTTTTTAPVTSTTSGVTTTTTLGETLCGDGNGDGSITASDALIALRTAVGSATCAEVLCDVDDSGTITAGDALRILANAVGQDVTLSCPTA
jgi:hypothetical protein